MSVITVLRPDVESPAAAPAAAAPRVALTGRPAITIIENGKPNARKLLGFIVSELGTRIRVGTVDVFSKPTAAKPIDADQARMLAARSRLVITGVGD